jgi:aryl-alcohol dehydrogenase-like predicted oxidoreductase
LEKRNLGESGPPVSSLGLGCNSLGHIAREDARSLIFSALDCGITLFDTAASYADGRSEEELGRSLPRDAAASVIITKFGHPSASTGHVGPAAALPAERALHASLRRLRRERIDIWMIHFPDPRTPLDETLLVIDRAIRAGQIGAYGVSNFSGRQLAQLLDAAERLGMSQPVVAEAEYNLLHRAAEVDLLPLTISRGIGFIPFFPLASGLLTGKYGPGSPTPALRSQIVRQFEARFRTPANWARISRLEILSAGHDVSMPHMALQWLATRPGISSIIAGASSAFQVEMNAKLLSIPLAAAALKAADDI